MQKRDETAVLLGFSIGSFPIKYLGLPLSSVYPKARYFSPLIDKVRNKIDGWQLNFLSFAGRAELIKGVLHNLLSYWVFSFKFPTSIVKELERIFSNFIWRGKMHAWNWHDICRPKSEGGVGIRNIKDINDTSGIRLVWRLYTSNALWSRWMRENYLKGIHLSQATVSVLISGTWKWVCIFKNQALSHVVSKVGNGKYFSNIRCLDFRIQ